ncbi:CHAD domain-containing protein [Luteolibacter marinus]|uniref:CHAD domain-containing protein n=1 Tax=Luteolibacter marinus TaxID=2776705 RepID=UPI0018683DE0|nr:CHAD domain-containing protein [Luteolibacter marinus]
MSEAPNGFAGARAALIGACGELERLLGGLNDSHGKVADEIHLVRKAGKRLRGGLAMVGEPKPCIRWIAVIGKMLGESRDATVRARTWKNLGNEDPAPDSVEAVIGSVLDLESDAARRCPPQAVIDWAKSAVVQVRARLEARGDEEVAESAAEGAAKLRRQLRKRLKRALQRSRNEDFHACRKAAKAWLGGMALVAPDVELPGGQEAERLCNSLGEENDLEVLADWMSKRGFSSATAGAAWKVLRKRQEKVRRRSISLIRKELSPVLKVKG